MSCLLHVSHAALSISTFKGEKEYKDDLSGNLQKKLDEGNATMCCCCVCQCDDE
jgi:hypothetical protein